MVWIFNLILLGFLQFAQGFFSSFIGVYRKYTGDLPVVLGFTWGADRFCPTLLGFMEFAQGVLPVLLGFVEFTSLTGISLGSIGEFSSSSGIYGHP